MLSKVLPFSLLLENIFLWFWFVLYTHTYTPNKRKKKDEKNAYSLRWFLLFFFVCVQNQCWRSRNAKKEKTDFFLNTKYTLYGEGTRPKFWGTLPKKIVHKTDYFYSFHFFLPLPLHTHTYYDHNNNNNQNTSYELLIPWIKVIISDYCYMHPLWTNWTRCGKKKNRMDRVKGSERVWSEQHQLLRRKESIEYFFDYY